MRCNPIFVCGERPATKRQSYFAKARGRRFEAKAGVIDLFDEIGAFGVSAADFVKQLDGLTGDVVLRINSPGGDVFDGIAIYNALLSHEGHVRVEIVGLAASAASIVAMAGDEIAIAENAFLMIHKAWGVTVGNSNDHDQASDLLGQIDQSLAATYAARSGLDNSTIASMMEAETWLGGEHAKASGFVTEVIAPHRANASFDLAAAYTNVPHAIAPVGDDHITIRDLEYILRDAGVPRRKAKALAAYGYKAPADQRDVDDEALSELAAHFAATAKHFRTHLN
jgi:ATP-dependent Clp protease, protease subunit